MTFISPSGKISIILRHQVYHPLTELKDIFGPENNINYRSEIINVNDIDVYVLERKKCSLQENSFEMRTWFRFGEEAYSLLLIYPDKYFESTKGIRNQIVSSLIKK
jgi:hypothetical protein